MELCNQVIEMNKVIGTINVNIVVVALIKAIVIITNRDNKGNVDLAWFSLLFLVPVDDL